MSTSWEPGMPLLPDNGPGRMHGTACVSTIRINRSESESCPCSRRIEETA